MPKTNRVAKPCQQSSGTPSRPRRTLPPAATCTFHRIDRGRSLSETSCIKAPFVDLTVNIVTPAAPPVTRKPGGGVHCVQRPHRHQTGGLYALGASATPRQDFFLIGIAFGH